MSRHQTSFCTAQYFRKINHNGADNAAVLAYHKIKYHWKQMPFFYISFLSVVKQLIDIINLNFYFLCSRLAIA